jgi:D-alanyl-D-alanine carboxypeptidase
LYALLLSSANDAATAIAISVGGDVDGFADMMNDTAKRLGLEDSHFMNPHGLDDDDHYTTAKDLARLTAYALKLPKFREIVSTYKKSISFNNKEGGRLLVNHNKLLNSYPNTIGVKTGFTKKSGRCLVSAAERNGTTLIAVTLNAPDDWSDHRTMLDFGFSNYESVELGDFSFELPVISGMKESVVCVTDQKFSVLLSKDHSPVEYRLEVYPFVYAPVSAGEKLGRIVYFCDGEEIGTLDITASERIDILVQKYTIWNRLFDKNKD